MRLFGYGLLCALSLLVAAYAVVAYGFFPLGVRVHPQMRAVFETYPLGILSHVFASALALALGPLQFSARLRARWPQVHRWSGRLYLGVGVLVGGVAGLFMAWHAYGGLVSQLGFAALAIAWLYTGARAYVAIRARDIAAHRRWMLRNFALTFAAVTLRLYLPVAFATPIGFDAGYPVIAWLCWVPNLLLVEAYLRRRGG